VTQPPLHPDAARDAHGLVWTPDGPRSARFDDVYFSAQDGLAESRAVFLQGCGLPDAWARRRRFTVAELGFGTGLNIAALLELWRTDRPAGARLQIFTVEAFPLSRDEAARALDRWPELAAVTGPLLARWPARRPGRHRLDLPELDAVVDLHVGEVAPALAGWTGRADAWFLDGFSPATNPAMWRDEVLGLVAGRSAPGARAATFTVAGAVRRGLAAEGFAVDKRPGFGRKKERLEARRPGAPTEPPPPGRIVVLGAGVAAAAIVRALRAQGLEATVIDRQGPGAGASGNAAALVAPRLDAGGGPVAHLSAQAFARAVQLYDETVPRALLSRGVLQIEGQARDRDRFDRLADQPLWADGGLVRLDATATGARLGEACDRGALWVADGLAVEPEAVLATWLGGAEIRIAEVAAITAREGGWAVRDAAGALVTQAEIVILANGAGLPALAPDLALQPVRGQATTAPGPVPAAAAWGGYVIPTRDGLLFGATHDKGETADDPRDDDDRRNLETLARLRPALAGRLDSKALIGRASVRITTPDRLPVCGALAPGLWVLGALGSRGFAFAPLLAEHLAAEISGAASPLSAEAAALVAPRRRDAKTVARPEA
jgi:tRNA 5-methylaminomethyl-2-thiouridine biosynthesis bifunctional protein